MNMLGSVIGMRGVVLIITMAMACSCGGRAPNEQSSAPPDPNAMTAPLQTFSQEITSPSKSLTMKASSTTEVPVTVRNTTQQLLSSTGQFPVNVSYKWFEGDTMLSIEGARTPLPHPLKPGETANVQVKVVAPDAGKKLMLKITLVQEAVQWFLTQGAAPLEIPVTME